MEWLSLLIAYLLGRHSLRLFAGEVKDGSGCTDNRQR